jgi:hypothetical protein
MKAGKHVIGSLAALVVIALATNPMAIAAPGGIPGKPAGTPGGKPEGAGKPEGTPGSHGKPTGTGKPEGTPGGGPPADSGATLSGSTDEAVGLDGAPTAHGGGPGPGGRTVGYVFKGTFQGPGELAGDAVAVDHTNRHAREFKGETVAFDFSAAKLSVADTNGDGAVELADVLMGDRVVVKAKLPKSAPGAQPFTAKQLTDETNPAPDDAGTG